MSSSEDKNNKKASRAHALAAWEWFKEAAWLQVLIIVAVVVGLVISIPFIVQAIVDALNDDDSNFYEAHRISYAQYERYMEGNDSNCAGLVGAGLTSYSTSDTEEGYVVMFYKTNDSECSTLQGNIETWFNEFNSSYGSNSLRFYAIQCDWVYDDEEDTATYEGQVNQYDNAYISLDEQQDVVDSVIDVYLAQDDTHQNSSVDKASLTQTLVTGETGNTLDVPLFITFTRDKATGGAYTMNKVIFGMIGSLSNSSEEDVSRQMLDIYNFQVIPD